MVAAMVVARELEQAHEYAPEVSPEAVSAFDYTCRYYLKVSGAEFLAKYDRGEIRLDDSNTALQRVLAMLPFVR